MEILLDWGIRYLQVHAAFSSRDSIYHKIRSDHPMSGATPTHSRFTLQSHHSISMPSDTIKPLYLLLCCLDSTFFCIHCYVLSQRGRTIMIIEYQSLLRHIEDNAERYRRTSRIDRRMRYKRSTATNRRSCYNDHSKESCGPKGGKVKEEI